MNFGDALVGAGGTLLADVRLNKEWSEFEFVFHLKTAEGEIRNIPIYFSVTDAEKLADLIHRKIDEAYPEAS